MHDFVGWDFSQPLIIPGPCAIETEAVAMRSAEFFASLGLSIMRGGCWKPRTSPYDFQGEGEKALHWALSACQKYGISTFVTEVVSHEVDDLIDSVIKETNSPVTVVRQVGTRNAQNFELLKHLGVKRNAVLLKRGMGNTLEEFLSAGEYILAGGNTALALCMRGHRLKSDQNYRFALDHDEIPELKKLTWLPVIYDPSHSTGVQSAVLQIADDALGYSADGLLIDVHPDASIAQCDAKQALSFQDFEKWHRNHKPTT